MTRFTTEVDWAMFFIILYIHWNKCPQDIKRASRLSTIFYNFCDFLFAFLHSKTRKGSTLQEKNLLLWEQILSLYSRPFSEGGANQFWQSWSIPLKKKISQNTWNKIIGLWIGWDILVDKYITISYYFIYYPKYLDSFYELTV